MTYFKHILTCLDLTSMDDNIISYTRYIAEVLKVEHITFFHVVQVYDIPEEDQAQISELKQQLHKHLKEKVDLLFTLEENKPGVTIRIRFENRDASDVIINRVREKDVDLTIVGKKAEADRKELYSSRIMALAESDLLLVPDNPPEEMNTIFAAIDFSRQSKKAFEAASKIAEEHHKLLKCHYIYSNPPLYFPIADKESLLKTVKDQGEKKAVKFFGKHTGNRALKFDYSIAPVTYSKQGWQLINKATNINASLIVIGARGRVSSTATLLGYICDSLRKHSSSIPILIFKNSIEKNSLFNIFLHG